MFGTLRFIFNFVRMARRRFWTPDAVAAYQQRRLRKLLKYAVRYSPFYQRKYHGLDVVKCPAAELPVLNKREMMANFDDVVTDRALKLADLQRFVEDTANLGSYFRARYVVCHTSGSQGQPAVIVQDKHAMAVAFGTQLARGNAVPKTFWSIAKNFFCKSRLAVVTLRPGFYPSGAAFEYMPPALSRFMRVLRISQTGGTEQVVSQLNDFQPNYLSAYASVLEMLAREERGGRLRLRKGGRLQQITNMSEPLPASSRQLLEEVFNVRVVDNYAMAECMALSNGCTRFSGSHVNIDQAMLDVVDEHNRPVPPGTPGAKVLVTNLYNYTQPLIRYEVGDVLTISPQPCPCGSNLPLVSAIQGRTKDKFWIRGDDGYREILPYVFMAPLLHCLDLAEYQVVQTDRNVFLVRAAPLPGVTFDLERMKRMLRQGLETDGLQNLLYLRYEIVKSIAPDPRSGKVKRMLSLIGPPAEKACLETDDSLPDVWAA